MSQEEFQEKIKKINDDTMYDSFFYRMVSHPCFIELLNEKENILPFIFEDIKIYPSWTHLNLLWSIVENPPDNTKTQYFKTNVENWLKWWNIKQREKKMKRIIKGN